MKDVLRGLIGIIIAFVIYTIFSRTSYSLVQIINVFSLLVIYYGVKKGEIFGACMGVLCGLIIDSFSFGVFGVAGISKTLTGFLAGYISKKVNVLTFSRNFLFIFILLFIEMAVWILLYAFIFSGPINTGGGLLFLQPLATALFGSLIFTSLEKWKRVFSRKNES